MVPHETDAIRALGARLIGDALIVFPVRHHSPACAWHLQQLLNSTPVSAVLVEGPRSYTRHIAQLTHAEARMPLAIYSYVVFERQGEGLARRRAAFYPFCDHSPELVALRHAQAHGIAARFIDLDFEELASVEVDADSDGEGDGEARSLLDERRFQRSQYITELATRLGCRNGEELWEHLFEVPAARRSLHEHVAAIAAYSHLARISCPREQLQADGTLAREAEMARNVRDALAQRAPGAGAVLAVIGGFHAVVLHELLDAAPGDHSGTPSGARLDEPASVECASQPAEDSGSAIIRYSFDRLDRLNGYAAGMTSPAWHQQLWERQRQHDKAGVVNAARVRREVALAVLLDIALELRQRHGLTLAMPTVAAAYEQALRLAHLRQRPAPTRDDVLDAVTSCFVKGDADADGTLVLTVARRALSGLGVGRAPPGVDRPPLVRDFEVRARRQRLKIDDGQPHRLVLDIYRRQDHRVTSRLLHGLVLLDVPLATRTAGPEFVHGLRLDRLQEHWTYAHSVAAEAALVEASIYGNTVPLAVANCFDERVERFEHGAEPRNADLAAKLLVQACVLGLHERVPRVAAKLLAAVSQDAEFESVTQAAGTLGLLWEARVPLEARAAGDVLLSLLRAAYERAIYLGGDMSGVRGDGSEFITGLVRLRELLVSSAAGGLDSALYWALIPALQRDHATPLVRGAAAGLLYGAAQLGDAELAAVVAGHLNGLLAPQDAVSFLRGLFKTAREAAWQQPALLAVLDRLLRQWDEAGFVAVLPELRMAFAEMTPKETDRIAQAVADLHGGGDLGLTVQRDITAAEVQTNLLRSQGLLSQLQADGLGGWVEAN